MSKRWWRPARLVFLTVHEDADFARAALDAGGLGYVLKARLASDLLGSFPAAALSSADVQAKRTLFPLSPNDPSLQSSNPADAQ